MENLYLLVWGLIIGSIISFLAVCYFFLSNPDRPNGPKFFVKPHENKAMHVKEGNKFSGRIILLSYTSYIDDRGMVWDFGDLRSGYTEEEEESFRQKDLWGIIWIGWPWIYSVHYRHQQWMEWKPTEKGRIIRFRDEQTSYLIIKAFEYAMLLNDAEDKNKVPLKVFFTVTLKPVNALLPVFGHDDAYGQIQTQCLAKALLFVKKETFGTLGADNEGPTEIINDLFSTELCDLNDNIPGKADGTGIKILFGYEIITAKLDNVEITGEQKETLQKASTIAYVKGEEAKANVKEAEGKRDADIEIAKGKEALNNVQVKYYNDIKNINGAMKVEERKATSGLTTLVEADSKEKTGILVNR